MVLDFFNNYVQKNHWLEFIKSVNKKIVVQSILNPDLEISTSPQYLILTLSDKCNLRCPHCWTHGLVMEKKPGNIEKDLDFSTVYQNIKTILPYIEEYSLTMTGEPLLVKNFEDIVLKFSKFGAKLNLVSNGTLISEKNIDILTNSSSNICISLDGARPEILEKLRKGVHFFPLIRNIKYLVDNINKNGNSQQPNVMISCTVMGSNINEMPGIVQLAHNLGVKYVQFYPVQLNDEQKMIEGELVEYHYEDFIKKIEECQELSKKIGIDLRLPNIENIIPKKDIDSKIFEKMIIPENLRFAENDPTEYNRKIIEQLNDGIKKQENSVKIQKNQGRRFSLSEVIILIKCYIKEIYIKYFSLKENNPDEADFVNLFFCEPLYKRAYISNEGDVAPCCIPGRPAMGNIFQQDLYRIWNGKEYRKFREKFQSPSPPACCNDCLFRQRLTKDILKYQL